MARIQPIRPLSSGKLYPRHMDKSICRALAASDCRTFVPPGRPGTVPGIARRESRKFARRFSSSHWEESALHSRMHLPASKLFLGKGLSIPVLYVTLLIQSSAESTDIWRHPAYRRQPPCSAAAYGNRIPNASSPFRNDGVPVRIPEHRALRRVSQACLKGPLS